MPDYDPAIALRLEKPPDLAPTFRTLAELQMAQAHSALYGAQAAFQQNRVNALARAGQLHQQGDTSGATNALLLADPEWASKFQDTVQKGRTYSALERYGAAASQGDPDAVGRIASVAPEEVARLAQARNTMKDADRKQYDLTWDAVGRSAQSILSAQPGTQRDEAYQTELKQLLDNNVISRRDYQGFLQRGTPNELALNNLVRHSMTNQVARESFGEKAAAEAPAHVATSLASNLGHPIQVEPNRVVTTGAQAVSPTVQAGIDDAFRRVGLGNGANPATPAPGAAVPPGTATPAPGPAGKGQDRVPQSQFAPRLIRNPDGSVSSSVTPGTVKLQEDAAARYGKAADNYQSAQSLGMRLDLMDHAIDQLNTTGWSSTGAGANAKIGMAKAANSVLQSVGLPAAFDPNKIASWEDFTKESTRAGFELAKTLGSREAMMIVQQAVAAVPNAENTYLGAKLVSSSLRQAAQREVDYYKFTTDYARQHNGDTFGADIAFNEQHSPQLYAKTAIANALPTEAVQLLRRAPNLSRQFDSKYGPGMSDFILNSGRR